MPKIRVKKKTKLQLRKKKKKSKSCKCKCKELKTVHYKMRVFKNHTIHFERRCNQCNKFKGFAPWSEIPWLTDNHKEQLSRHNEQYKYGKKDQTWSMNDPLVENIIRNKLL